MTVLQKISEGTEINAEAGRVLLNGHFELAAQLYEMAAEYTITPEGRAALLRKAAEARAAA